MKATVNRFTAFALGLLLSCPWQAWVPVQAQSLKEFQAQQQTAKPTKFAPDLEELLADDDEEQRQALQGKTLAQARQERWLRATQRAQREGNATLQRQRINGLLLPSAEVLADEKQSFIVQLDPMTPSVVFREKVAQLGGAIRQMASNNGLVTIEAPRSVVRQLATESSVTYVSPDRPIAASGHLETTTGAAQIRSLISKTTLNGNGIGIAVIDSGIAADHHMLNPSLVYSYYTFKADGSYSYSYSYNDPAATVVSAQQSFLANNYATDDTFGHGTHVASMIGGSANFQKAYYSGVAPGAKLLNLRVLDSNGVGAASSVIAAIDWCITNRTTYNIRVINLSLGTMAKDSYRTDPLCLAARRAVNAGIVVIAAAGNDGKDANGNKIYGGIHSPGIDPSVITVGAANTFGTDTRTDDAIASFSSRGPTRSYTVVNGIRKYDNLIKPDLVAPGNRIISAQSYNREAASSGETMLLASTMDTGNTGSQTSSGITNNNLVQGYPTLNVFHNLNDTSTYQLGNTGGGSGIMAIRPVTIQMVGTMQLSGTSMSAPVVSGAVALMLQANPQLTPNLVKAILMYTAQPLKGFNMLEQGAGELNIDGAVRIARLVKSTLPTTNGAALLSTTLPAQQSTIAGATFKWGQGVLTNYGFLFGSALLTAWQPVYASGQILSDATGVINGSFSKLTGKTSTGVSLKAGAWQIQNNGVVLSDATNTIFVNGVVLSDGVVLGDGLILGDGVVLSDGLVLGDGTTRADATLKPASATSLLGDNTSSMQPAP